MPRALIPALVAVVLLAGGCADDAGPDGDAGRERDRERAARAAEPTPTQPTATSSPSKPAGTPSAATRGSGGGKIAPPPLAMARPDGSRAHLLTAASLPPAAPGSAWTVRSTGPEGSRPLGACQQASLEDIGALHAVIRDFAGPDGSGVRARQLVARLADAKSAWRTHEVLRSWRAECEERFGIVRAGRWLSVVEATSTEGDVPQAWTRRAVRRIAATFG